MFSFCINDRHVDGGLPMRDTDLHWGSRSAPELADKFSKFSLRKQIGTTRLGSLFVECNELSSFCVCAVRLGIETLGH